MARRVTANTTRSLFLRAIGLKPSFRRTGPSSLLHLAVAAGIGAVSGYYIFKEPLEQFAAENPELFREDGGRTLGIGGSEQQQLGVASKGRSAES